jgi:4-diphosphocytidyl-2-C-methyl-D-erythritol kinase
LEVKAYAKINLTLDILRKREDGFHDLEMVMQSISLYDTIHISTVTDSTELTLHSSVSFLPSDERNLAAKAAKAFFTATGKAVGLEIELRKRIPICAGLAGGSTDAAAVLLALNELTGARLTEQQLMKIGEQVGSDVPYCVLGKTALAQGRGEVLTQLPALPLCHVVLCKPKFSISTPELFARVDCKKISCRPDTAGMLTALSDGNLKGVARRVYNVFEDVLPARQRAMVDDVKQTLVNSGALGAAMTGTGSAVFGLFESGFGAKTAYQTLLSRNEEAFLLQTV